MAPPLSPQIPPCVTVGAYAPRDSQPLIQRILSKIYCFDGDASAVPITRQDAGRNVHEIRARVQPHMQDTLIKLLSVCDFPDTWRPHPLKVDCYTIADGPTGDVIELEIRGLTRFSWRQQLCDFDVDLLYRNENSMYMADDTNLLRSKAVHRGDPLNYICRRVNERRFCLMRSSYNADGRTPIRMNRAYDMVKSGWRMDIANSIATWFICPWWLLSHPNLLIRFMFGIPPQLSLPYHSNTTNATCVLCHEQIDATDSVMRLACGHVFHCRCRDGNAARRRATIPVRPNQTVHQQVMQQASGEPQEALAHLTQAAHTQAVQTRAGRANTKDGIIRWFEGGNSACPMCRLPIGS